MSERLHPDIDSLSALAEGALPEHERLECLSHIADCPQCREVVFLAQEPAPQLVRPFIRPVSWWRRFAPVTAVAAVVLIAGGMWKFLRPGVAPTTRQETAQVAPPIQSPQANPEPPPILIPSPGQKAETVSSKLPPAKKPPLLPRPYTPPPAPEVATVTEPSIPLPPPGTEATPVPSVPSFSPLAAAAPPPPARVSLPADDAASGISGRITDPTGAVVSGAKVELQQLAGKKNDNAFSDAKGQFKFSDLPPGRYQLRVVVPGFRMHSQLVEVKLQEMATVKPELQVGSAMDSVTVTSGAPILQTAPAETLSKSGPPELGLLPSKLPAALTASHGKIMVAVDTAGALFYSENSGTAWKPVQPVWQGQVIGLISPAEAPQPPSVAFQLTTGDSNAVWLSRDGRHWYSAAPQH